MRAGARRFSLRAKFSFCTTDAVKERKPERKFTDE
jgi:hypothetical protein